MIQLNDRVPDVVLMEYQDVETEGCSIGPAPVRVSEACKGKTVAIFGLPGAFTPTCSAKHLPGYVTHAGDLRAAGVDEIWCVSVNDAFVMGAWGREQHAGGAVRMMADGSADWARATGLTLDLTAKGMGLRSNRYSMLVVDGVVRSLNNEGPGQFQVSNVETLLEQARGLTATA
jgi:peroxiredoxin